MSSEEGLLKKENSFELFAILRNMVKQGAYFYMHLSHAKRLEINTHSIAYPYVFFQCTPDYSSGHKAIKVSGDGLEEKIEFSLSEIIEVNADDGHVSGMLRGKVSAKFKYIQRRRNLRVPLPLSENFKINMIFNDEEVKDMMIYDLSIGGVGVYSYSNLPAGFSPGIIIPKVRLDFGAHGSVLVNIKVLAVNKVERYIESEREIKSQLSIKFIKPSEKTTRNLSKILYILLVKFNIKR